MTFPYRTQPYGEYQRDILRKTAYQKFWFHAWEQGTGKSWISIVTGAALYQKGKINAMLVLAPNGVHTAWVRDQIPEHMPAFVPWTALAWDSGDIEKRQKVARKHLPKSHSKVPQDIKDLVTAAFPILCVNSECIGRTRNVAHALSYFLRMRKCLLIVDESSDFTTPSAVRTMALQKLGKVADYRRCLDGTPSDGDPFDLYAPYRFLSPSILGYNTFKEMKLAHATWIECERHDGRKFPMMKKDSEGRPIYHDLDKLKARADRFTSRVTKAEVLNLPPKLFSKRYFELTPEQKRLSLELKHDLTTRLASGSTVTVDNVLTFYLRLQQIACGYVPVDVPWKEVDDEEDAGPQPIELIAGGNPRLEMAVDEIRRRARGGPVVCWTRYHMDIDLLLPELKAIGLTVATYDGRVPRHKRTLIDSDFRRGDYDTMLANPAAGGRGLNWQRSSRVVYYANYFGLRRRLQSEDRTHRIGTSDSVGYTDIVGIGCPLIRGRTIDEHVIHILRHNQSVADILTGDPTKESWL